MISSVLIVVLLVLAITLVRSSVGIHSRLLNHPHRRLMLNQTLKSSGTFVGTTNLQPAFFAQLNGAFPGIIQTFVTSQITGGAWSCGGGCSLYVGWSNWAATSIEVSGVSVTVLDGAQILVSASVSVSISVNGLNGANKYQNCWIFDWFCSCDESSSCSNPGSATATFQLSLQMGVSPNGQVQSPSVVGLGSYSLSLNSGGCAGLCSCGSGCQSTLSSSVYSSLSTLQTWSSTWAAVNSLIGVFESTIETSSTNGVLLLSTVVAGNTYPQLSAFPASSVGINPTFLLVEDLQSTVPVPTHCDIIQCPMPQVDVLAPVSAEMLFTTCAGCMAAVNGQTYYALLVASSLGSS